MINTRTQQKIDTQANWEKAVNFTPLKGEIIVYEADETYDYPRIKIGDGTTKVNGLPFVSAAGSSEKVFSEVGEIVELEIEPGTPMTVVSKINRDEKWGWSNKLILHQVNNTNFVDLTSFLGGAGTVYSKNGLTATINDNSTITVQGTNESTGWTNLIEKYHWNGEQAEKIYPAGTYRVPSGFMMNVRAAQHPEHVVIDGVGSNLQGTVTIPEPFRIISLIYPVAGSKEVNTTVPLGLFRGNTTPETNYEYSGSLYTVTFDSPVYEGEFNWTTGELKNNEGEVINYYDTTDIVAMDGINYFWTGFGENVISNKKTEGNVILGMNQVAPEETVTSICDFTLTPKTMEAAYSLYHQTFLPGQSFYGTEVPTLTTKGTLSVKDVDGNIKYSKYIEPIFNSRGVKDLLTQNGLEKRWSKKYYLTKSPISTTHIPPRQTWHIDNYVFIWEFDESDFANSGIPAKLHDIPIASACFINNDESEIKVDDAVLYQATPYPAFFSYNEETGKYTLTVRGIQGSEIHNQLTTYSKVYFYYQLENPYDLPFNFAMGIEAGDTITFDADLVDAQPYMEHTGLLETLSDNVTEFNVDPSVVAFVPRDTKSAMVGMRNAATILNSDKVSDTTVQSYDWIGDADASVDYTKIIQNKINEVYKTQKIGTIQLGKGTYKISSPLILYSNINLVGQGIETTIAQTSDHTHGIVISGSKIGIEKLNIKLLGNCDGTENILSQTQDKDVIGCIYVNSENTPSESKYNPNYPDNYYCQHILIRDVNLYGTYSFDHSSGAAAFPANKDTYKGCGIVVPNIYFNYAQIDNVRMDGFFAGYYGQGGSNITNIYCTGSRVMVCDYTGYNSYTIKGHPYYATNANGDIISLSQYVVYSNGDGNNFDITVFDQQWFTNIAYFDTYSMNNKYIINQFSGGYLGFVHPDKRRTLDLIVKNLGRGNVNISPHVNTPFHIGSRQNNLSGQTEFKASNPILSNTLTGAGIWGSITSNTEWRGDQMTFKELCKYPKDSDYSTYSTNEPTMVSLRSPSVDNPIEIIIDISNRPTSAFPNFFIQFNHQYVAQDFSVELYSNNNTVEHKVDVTNNEEVVYYYNYNQISNFFVHKIKITITKALEIENFKYRNSAYVQYTEHYNPNKLIGICNIGIIGEEFGGRAYLGAYGGNMYGELDMSSNRITNVATPTENMDAVNKEYLEDKYYTKEEVNNLIQQAVQEYINSAILNGEW